MRYNPRARLDRSQVQRRSGGGGGGFGLPVGGGGGNGIKVGGGIGGLVIYFVDKDSEQAIWRNTYVNNGADPALNDKGLSYIDHLTHNLNRGNMDKWAGFYERLFNFRQVRYFDIAGKLTGLHSRAMTCPDG